MTPQEHAQQTFKEGKWHDSCPYNPYTVKGTTWLIEFMRLVETWINGAYKPSDDQSIMDWLNDAKAWAEEQAEQEVSIIMGEKK